jgi:hypothetical protein
MTDAAAARLAAAIADCLEPLAQLAEKADDFDQRYDASHLALMKLFDASQRQSQAK